MKILSKGTSKLWLAGWFITFTLVSGRLMASETTEAEQEYMSDDPRLCLMCHGADSNHPAESVMHGVHGQSSSENAPFSTNQQGCQSCHGPSAAHLKLVEGVRPPPAIVFNSEQPAHQRDGVCLDCHQDTAGHYWAGSAHEFSQQGCTSCHTIHQSDGAMKRFLQLNNQCMDCHQRQRAQIMRPSSHPLRSGQMNCIDCHSPHGGPGPAELKAFTLNEQCLNCHAEKRGPFLWEHAPVTEDCSSCHTPHGSNHNALLNTRTPFLCQQCHQAAFHPSNQESGLGIPPRGASSNLLGKDCMNCHAQVHGSNHPSGSGLTR